MSGEGKDRGETVRRAGSHVMAFLAGMTAMGLITDEPADKRRLDKASLPPTQTDTYDQGSDYYDSSVANEFPTSRDAINAAVALNKELGPKLSVTPEQRAQVRSMIDTYVAAHPPRVGAIAEHIDAQGEKITSSEASYDPLYDLWGAATTLEINPLLLGLILKELSDRMDQGPQ